MEVREPRCNGVGVAWEKHLMKVTVFLMPAAMLLALGGCGKKQDNGAIVGAQISSAGEGGDSVRLEPGEWMATQEIVDVKIDGMPEDAPNEALTQMIGRRTNINRCLTPEQAAKPAADFLAAQKQAKCRSASFSMRDGRASADMTCAAPDQPGATMHMVMQGTYTADRYDMDMNVESRAGAEGPVTRMKMKSTGQRLGDCVAEGNQAGN